MLIEKIITEARTSFKKLNYDRQYDLVKNYVLNETDFKSAKQSRFISTFFEDSAKETAENTKAYGRFYTWYYTRHCIPKTAIITHIAGSVPDRMYDHFRIDPVRMVDEGFEVCDPEEEPDLWSAYVCSKEGYRWWIADCRTEDDATQFVNILTTILWVMLHPRSNIQIRLSMPVEELWFTQSFTTDTLLKALATFVYIANKQKGSSIPDDPELIQSYLIDLNLLPTKQAA